MRIFIILILLFFSSSALASPKSYIVEKGQSAPDSGILLNQEAVVKLLTEIEYRKEKSQLEKEKELKEQQQKHKLELENLKIRKETEEQKLNKILKIKDVELKKYKDITVKSAKSAAYTKWWFLGGIATGIASTIGMVFLIKEAGK